MASLATRTIYHPYIFHPNSSQFLPFPSSINLSRSSPVHLRRSSCGSLSNHSRSFPRCHAGTPGPPPPEENEIQPKGITSTISRFWDTMQIFIAVFIWMSLFFWASASDRRNNGGINKGGRFRK
ncbi:hypothetical protein RND81_14G180600 [Saponaria officinalis]|uniref:Uncharacterized protein n=1 Tax=Saponaria officinalis TaxID=3572 RepID=A0AAW1GRB2_SAPOF